MKKNPIDEKFVKEQNETMEGVDQEITKMLIDEICKNARQPIDDSREALLEKWRKKILEEIENENK